MIKVQRASLGSTLYTSLFKVTLNNKKGIAMIYTSYYARARSFPNFVHIRVSTSSPKWYPFNTECLPELYPGFNLVNDLKTGRITEEEYTRKY